jgi:hypothetical protein
MSFPIRRLPSRARLASTINWYGFGGWARTYR